MPVVEAADKLDAAVDDLQEEDTAGQSGAVAGTAVDIGRVVAADTGPVDTGSAAGRAVDSSFFQVSIHKWCSDSFLP